MLSLDWSKYQLSDCVLNATLIVIDTNVNTLMRSEFTDSLNSKQVEYPLSIDITTLVIPFDISIPSDFRYYHLGLSIPFSIILESNPNIDWSWEHLWNQWYRNVDSDSNAFYPLYTNSNRVSETFSIAMIVSISYAPWELWFHTIQISSIDNNQLILRYIMEHEITI